MPHSRIARDPKVMMGKPVIASTRITVRLFPGPCCPWTAGTQASPWFPA